MESRLRSRWGHLVFAAVWAGLISGVWGYIRMSAPLRALIARGEHLNWALSLLYSTAIYIGTVVLILWFGLALYLALTHSFRFKHLARGLVVIVFSLFVALGIESFARVGHVPAFLEYLLAWLPMFFALSTATWLAEPLRRPSVLSRAAGNS